MISRSAQRPVGVALLAPGAWWRLHKPAATPEEIEAAVRRFIDPANLTTIKAGDFH
jgi:hypothetical protein